MRIKTNLPVAPIQPSKWSVLLKTIQPNDNNVPLRKIQPLCLSVSWKKKFNLDGLERY